MRYKRGHLIRRNAQGGWAWLAPVLGAVAGGLFGNKGQGDANDTNRQIARDQMAFQERMSNSEYQRSANDLRMAGMNPMLSLMKGGGASTPPGASTHVESTTRDAANSAASLVPLLAELALKKEQTSKTNAEADLARAHATMAQNQVPYSAESALQSVRKLTADTETAIHGSEIARIERLSDTQIYKELQPLLIKYQTYVTEMARLGIPEAKAQAEFWGMMAKAGNTGKAMEFLKKMIGGLSMKGGNTYNPTTIIRR